MEFWGVEVKAGEPVSVVPEPSNVLHLSQAVLGESKKSADSVVIYGKVGGQKLVLGHLIPGQIPQLSFDLVFDGEFELSHSGKNGSVHFAGYKSVMGEEEEEGSEEDFGDSSSEEEEELAEPVPVMATENGKVENAKAAKSNAVKPESSGKQKVKIEEPVKDEADEDDSDSDMDSMDEDSSDDDVDDSEDSEEEDEETPTPKKKPESKKRAQVSGSEKTPVSAKKSKLATPQKTDGKKGGHTDTPHPAKKGKTPATEKSKAQTPKSAGGNFSCGSCSKTFGSDGALQSHSKAKHSAGK